MKISATQRAYLTLVMALCLAPIVSATNASAGDFKKEHPRRAQVLKREKHQVNRINRATTNKKITYQQASKLKHEENNIRKQEQQMASSNGGHITKAEQKSLNQEENHVMKEMRHDEYKDSHK